MAKNEQLSKWIAAELQSLGAPTAGISKLAAGFTALVEQNRLQHTVPETEEMIRQLTRDIVNHPQIESQGLETIYREVAGKMQPMPAIIGAFNLTEGHTLASHSVPSGVEALRAKVGANRIQNAAATQQLIADVEARAHAANLNDIANHNAAHPNNPITLEEVGVAAPATHSPVPAGSNAIAKFTAPPVTHAPDNYLHNVSAETSYIQAIENHRTDPSTLSSSHGSQTHFNSSPSHAIPAKLAPTGTPPMASAPHSPVQGSPTRDMKDYVSKIAVNTRTTQDAVNGRKWRAEQAAQNPRLASRIKDKLHDINPLKKRGFTSNTETISLGQNVVSHMHDFNLSTIPGINAADLATSHGVFHTEKTLNAEKSGVAKALSAVKNGADKLTHNGFGGRVAETIGDAKGVIGSTINSAKRTGGKVAALGAAAVVIGTAPVWVAELQRRTTKPAAGADISLDTGAAQPTEFAASPNVSLGVIAPQIDRTPSWVQRLPALEESVQLSSSPGL